MAKSDEVKGCLIQRKGRYYVVIYYYVDGHRMTETKSTGILVNAHKKREAEKIKNELIENKMKELEHIEEDKSMHSFAECYEKWVHYKSTQTERTTAKSYIEKSKGAIEYFKEKQIYIEKLKPKELLDYYEWALKYGRRNVYKEGGSTALKRRTVQDQATLIKSFLNDAVVQGIISVNPADKVQVPRVKEDNTHEIAYIDQDEAKIFLNYLKSEPLFEKLYCICKIGLCYGLRRSEIIGLKWSAIDFENNEIEIRHTVVKAFTSKEFRDNVKTASSHRYLPLLENIRIDLLELREKQKRQGIYSDDGYLFKWEDGRVYSPDYITKLFIKAAKRSKCVPENLTLHGLRHSCCTILFENGWTLEKVKNWLGHSDISVTSNIYHHVSKRWMNKQGKIVDELFG